MVGPWIDVHMYAQCSHASVGLAQARPNYVSEVDSQGFLEERHACSFSECALREISDAFVDTKLRGIEATCIIVVTEDDLA